MEDKEKEIPVEDSREQDMTAEQEHAMSDRKHDKKKKQKDGEKAEIEKLKRELEEAKDKYLRLYSEFENYRRRTAKERLELISNANEDLLVHLLPVLDDFERAQKAMQEHKDHSVAEEGFNLIYSKLKNLLEQKGLKEMQDGPGTPFNPELHHAISQMPVEKKKMKGKIVDVVEKGYYLNDKVIRFAKVVTGV